MQELANFHDPAVLEHRRWPALGHRCCYWVCLAITGWLGLCQPGLSQLPQVWAAEAKPADNSKPAAQILPAEELKSSAVVESAVIPGINERYDLKVKNVDGPDFRKHVVPLLGKLGCNGRACHGSFQGQGGFRLSLFGYDFKADHENLVLGDKPRVNLMDRSKSLILMKPTEQVPHEGGEALKQGTWEYRVLDKWISQGAKPVTDKTPEFVRLDVLPDGKNPAAGERPEMVGSKVGQSWKLKCIAVWSDGTREDVTPLSRFQSNNDQIAKVTQEGMVTITGPGDSHVVAFYDNGVVPVPVILPVSNFTGDQYPSTPTPTRIDELVVQKLKKVGVVQSDLCGDEEFLRRVSLDITGTLPTPEEVETFVRSKDVAKRSKKIDELLERPAYAAWQATKICDYTGNNPEYLQNAVVGNNSAQAARDWYEWIHDRVQRNVPYDELAENIILATSRREGESYEQYCERVSGYYAKDSKGSFAEQPAMTHYWARRNFRTVEERALGFAYTFLGIRVQCAQCHKHPFDQWTKDDFDRFKNFFARIRYGDIPGNKDEKAAMLAKLGVDKDLKGNMLDRALKDYLASGKVVPVQEVFVTPPVKPRPVNPKAKPNAKRPQVVAGRTAKVLGGDEIVIEELDDPRTALMDWLRAEENPYFARAFVNRVWAGYFHVGIVEPPDDLSLANPPSNEALLDELTREFVAHGYDMKWLHRTIANSRTYQLSWQPNETNKLDERNFARAVPRRLPAEVAYDIIRQATASDFEMAKWNDQLNSRAIEDVGAGAKNGRAQVYALNIFGRSIRESNCDCDRSMEPSLLQTVYLQNDQELLAAIERKGGWVDQIVKVGPHPVVSDKNAITPAAAVVPDLTDEKGKGKKKLESATEDSSNDRDLKEVLARVDKRIEKARQQKDKQQLAELQQTRQKVLEKIQAQAKTTAKPVNQGYKAGVLPSDRILQEIVKTAYLRTLSRYPSNEETRRSVAYFHEAKDVRVGSRDLLWALLNTKEFMVNH
ncbi:protein of unknown function DUF1549 [Planctopirus limnophila DSM 3776]|uniref:DUF1549 domain-containing protein n=1 Tax=Planctopirus limnophila (strain ATCC 43296 / DSM 3776 / IFAM 1008 / Mu 290) TaxID=521674 RepID=D5SZ04_PLAL2|nr:DUF1549 domain-containing protein [Planctopirus limnophila]ADG69905.1 protein of unknown function DUF1549 [Planctopirus limnophila DSM 3776]